MKKLGKFAAMLGRLSSKLGIPASNILLLGAGSVAVFLILSSDFISSELFSRETLSVPSAGSVSHRDVYSGREFKITLEGKDIQVLRGEKLVSRGDRVTADQEAKLRAYLRGSHAVNYSHLWGNLVLTLCLTMLLLVYIFHSTERLEQRTNHPLLLAVVVGILALSKVAVVNAVSLDLLYLINPLPVALILIAIFISTELAVIVAVLLSILLGLLCYHPQAPLGFMAVHHIMAYALIGGLTGIFSCSPKQSERWDILRAGMAVGLTNVVTILAFNLIFQDRIEVPTFLSVFENTWYGLCNGVGCAMLVLGLIPFLEDIFQVTTSTRLLELINPNQPLLQKLITEAPGTFHHSQNVAHLAEKAAEEIGADPYLAKAAAYYHDLGKTERPYYFIENQMGGVNPHDTLSPQLSKLIIHSHTKDGIEIAKKYGLPKAITDIMVQHHGTDLVAFFYHRARQNEAEGEHVDEQEFRYAGTKPQTKEAAIIMLADAVEAASRTLRKPTPNSIENLVGKIINDKFVDGQFDECELTKRDCELVADSFSKTLMGMYHSRIQYPQDLAERAARAQEAGTASPKPSGGEGPDPASPALPDAGLPTDHGRVAGTK